MHAIFDHEKPL